MEETTGRNTDFRKAGGVLALTGGATAILFAVGIAVEEFSRDAVYAAAILSYPICVFGALLLFSRRGKTPGIALLVLAVPTLPVSPPSGLMTLTAGVFGLIGQSGSRSGGFGKRMMAKAQRMAEAAKQADAGDANETKG